MNPKIQDTKKTKRKLTSILTAATLTLAFTATTTHAGDRQKFTDYARVVHVEPAFRYVTVKVPQKVCTPHYNNHTRGQHTNHHQRHNSQNLRHQTNQHTTRRRDSTGAVFIGGVIGGAIGHEVSKSINGRGSAGATIAGAIIGSTLANSATHNQPRGNYGNNRTYVTSTRHTGHNNRGQRQRHRTHNHQPAHRNEHHNNRHQNRHQRCTTTTETRRQRHNAGYDVTYIYKGRSFTTRTQHHPGNSIAVQVAVSTR